MTARRRSRTRTGKEVDVLKRTSEALAEIAPALSNQAAAVMRTDCLVLNGSDATNVLDAARTARDGDVWQPAGATYDVVFRPLLPDERTCDDVS